MRNNLYRVYGLEFRVQRLGCALDMQREKTKTWSTQPFR
jgi:hypothetical protein